MSIHIRKSDMLKKWKVIVDHPLVLITNTLRPELFMVEHLMESEKKRVLFRFANKKIVAIDRLETNY